MSGWYYRQSGMVEDTTVGPFDDREFLQLALDGKIALNTPVAHPNHTKGQWVLMERIPAARNKYEEGDRQRKAVKAEKQRQKEQAHQEEQARKEAARQRAIQEAAERTANSPIASFLLDGQSETTVAKIYDRLTQILTPQETLEYIAVQAKPIAIAPDCVAITNRRFILFHQKMLGQLDFEDYLWMYLRDAKLKEGVLYAEVSFRATDGRFFSVDYLPKSQARRIYRIAQQREEEAIEIRRNRAMEETRAGASNIVVNATATPASPSVPVDDPVVKLQKLKQMLDAGLIEKEEYDAAKAKVLSSM